MNQQASLFSQTVKKLGASDEKKTISLPFKDHVQIQLILDTLARRDRHHVLLTNCVSEKIQLAVLDSVAQKLMAGHVGKKIDEVIYFDVTAFLLTAHTLPSEKIMADFAAFCTDICQDNKKIVFAFNQPANSKLNL